MPHRSKSSSKPTATIEICGPVLHLAVVEPSSEGQSRKVRTKSSRWKSKSQSPYSAAGIDELIAAIRALLDEAHVATGRLSLTLNGDYCVTRVATGSVEQVRRELVELEQRSAGYLTLGHGRKSLATCIESLDARHEHALLCVTNRNLIEALVGLGKEHDLTLDRIEPSLVSLSRIAARMGRDEPSPVLIASISEAAVELGISHRGRLLLDYRPGGRTNYEHVATIVSHHLNRLNRYCSRYYDHSVGQLETILLFGPDQITDEVARSLAADGHLTPEIVDPKDIDSQLVFLDQNPASETCAAIGTCFASDPAGNQHVGPNLMDRLRAENLAPIWPQLRRTAWPVAAVLLIAVGMFGLNLREASNCRTIEQQIASHTPAVEKTTELKRRLAAVQRKSAHLRALKRAINNPQWDQFLRNIAGAMPRDVWLGALIADAETGISIRGRSFTEESVFELVRWLESGPMLTQVAPKGTRDAHFAGDPIVEFDVECKLVDLDGQSGGDDGID